MIITCEYRDSQKDGEHQTPETDTNSLTAITAALIVTVIRSCQTKQSNLLHTAVRYLISNICSMNINYSNSNNSDCSSNE